MRATTIVMTFGALMILALSAWLAFSAPLPGELAGPHAGVPELAAPDGCESCHRGDGFRSGCLECHEPIAHQIRESQGYHSVLTDGGEARCAICHGEHWGASYDLVPDRAWPNGSKDSFDHGHVAFDLQGAHDALACGDCHRRELANAEWPEAREHSYLGLNQACARCHTDPHAGDLGEQCRNCHTQEAFRPAPGFDHVDSFPLVDSHAELTCEACHAIDRDAKRLTFGSVKGNDCASCHESPHTSPNEIAYGGDCESCHQATRFQDVHFEVARHADRFPLRGQHASATCASCHQATPGLLADRRPDNCASCHENPHLAATSPVQLAPNPDCTSCHDESSWNPELTAARQQHAATDFPLIGAHEGSSCESCHGLGRTLEVETPVACTLCHATPHRASWNEPCAACHPLEDTHWREAAPRLTADEHARAGFAFEPPHVDLECRSCHPPVPEPFATRFPGRAPEQCASCHGDPHAGQFEERFDRCTSCHAADHFQPSLVTSADHLSFPLEGGHLAVPCVSCHARDDALGARRFVGLGHECASCHDNPHGTQFTREMKQGSCEACHQSFEGWDDPPFDHGRTRFALEGFHTDVTCESCHKEDAAGIRRYRNLPTDCASCHTDPHRGQLTSAQKDCTHCHGVSRRWKATTFDHQKDARFALDGKHVRVPCRGCHPEEETDSGEAFIRYKPIGQRCQDCHDFDR